MVHLMVHFGKKVDGKYTRRSLAAEKLNEYLVQAEKRRTDLQQVRAQLASLSAQFAEMSSLLRDRERLFRELRQSIEESEGDILAQNPNADRGKMAQEAAESIADFHARCKDAARRVDSVKQSITVKQSDARRQEERLDFYRKQVERVMRECEAA